MRHAKKLTNVIHAQSEGRQEEKEKEKKAGKSLMGLEISSFSFSLVYLWLYQRLGRMQNFWSLHSQKTQKIDD